MAFTLHVQFKELGSGTPTTKLKLIQITDLCWIIWLTFNMQNVHCCESYSCLTEPKTIYITDLLLAYNMQKVGCFITTKGWETLGLLIIKFVMKIWSWCFIFPSRKYKRFSDVRSIKKLLTEMNYTMIYICNEEKYLYTKYRRPTTNALAAASITCVEHSSMRIQYLGNVMASICFSH